jgi:hypothetical protein
LETHVTNIEAILIGLLSVAHTREQAEHAARTVLRDHRAAVLREAADAIAAQDPATAPLVGVHARSEDVALLRRMAAEDAPAVRHLAHNT